MPIYEYQCEGTCKEKFEVIHKTIDSIFKCFKCLGPVRKLISAPSVIVEGKVPGPDLRKDPEIIWKSET